MSIGPGCKKHNNHTSPCERFIRPANTEDLLRIAEIYVFNNRLVYFPIINDVLFSFKELTVQSYIKKAEARLHNTYVYDDGVVKGFMVITGTELCKLHVDYFFKAQGIGRCLLEYAVQCLSVDHLWTLKKNEEAIKFYKHNGFEETPDEKGVPGNSNNSECVIKMILFPRNERSQEI